MITSPVQHHESGHYRFRPAYHTRRAHPVDQLLLWVLDGDLALTVDGVATPASAGDLVVLRSGVPHTYGPTSDGGWEWLWCHLDGPGAGDLLDLITPGSVRRVRSAPLARARFTELVDTAATAGDDAVARLRVDSCLFSLLGLLAQSTAAGPADDGEVAALTRWVTDHLDRALTLDDLARAAGRSPAQLTRVVRRATGLPPLRFVSRLKVREAERMLVDTDLTVAEVARRVGFADPLHFSRRFTQLAGRTPSSLRRLVRHDDGSDRHHV